MRIGVIAIVAALTASGISAAADEELEEVLVTARRTMENAQDVPVAVVALPAERLANYDIDSLEKLAAVVPDMFLTRGNSGSGMIINLRGIGPDFSSIGMEQSVAVVVDDVYYGQGRVIDEAFTDLDRIEVLKGPQALFFGKNSTAGVISITTANPGPEFDGRARVGYDFVTQNPQGEVVISGPVTDSLGLRLVISGQDMFGGYVRNDAPPGTYTTIDASTLAPTAHYVPAPDPRDLPAESTVFGRLTATYRPNNIVTITLKASATRDQQGGTSWDDRLWRCPSGHGTFPGGGPQPCGDGFEIMQNPVPADIAATRPDMSREGGQLYTEYESRAITAQVDARNAALELTSVTNYQHFEYSSLSDYDFTAVPSIWGDQDNSYRAVSEELRARTVSETGLNVLGGVYYQSTAAPFYQGAMFYGSENDRAPLPYRYISVEKNSDTVGQTLAAYGQVSWTFLTGWELTGGARYTRETKNSYFIQPYVNPFFAALYAQNQLLSADQFFRNVSPEATLTWRPTQDLTLYAAYRTGYKSGGFSNSTDDVVNTGGLKNLTFGPETARGGEMGVKATFLERRLRVNADLYHYRFNGLQVEFFNPSDLALVDLNAGAATSEGAEIDAEYVPALVRELRLHGSVNYNVARYQEFIGPCYEGQTQAQGCNLVGSPPGRAPLQDLSGRPTLDSPKWTATLGADYERRVGGGLSLGGSADLRFSGAYAVSPFAQPLDFQSSFVTLDAALRLRTNNGRWQVALIGKNLTDRFIVTYAADTPSTGSLPGGKVGVLADQYGIFAPARTVQLAFTAKF